jgi:hypothetical protein
MVCFDSSFDRADAAPPSFCDVVLCIGVLYSEEFYTEIGPNWVGASGVGLGLTDVVCPGYCLNSDGLTVLT